MSIRCRGPSGLFVLSGLQSGQSFLSLCLKIADKSGIALDQLELLAGYPPKSIKVQKAEETSISAAGVILGDQITVRQSASPSIQNSDPSDLASASHASLPQNTNGTLHRAANPGVAQQPTQDVKAVQDVDHDVEEMTRAMQLSLKGVSQSNAAEQAVPKHEAKPAASANPPVQTSSSNQSIPTGAPSEVELWDGTCLTRRIIAADNSCLFNAVGYVMERSRNMSTALRSIIVDAVRSDPETYSEAFLGQSNEAYQKWIKNSQKWGGAIELSILSRHFGREIAAYDIHTQRMDVYGEGCDYSERAMLIYDGLHYDALALAAFKDAPEELDVTIFETASTTLPPVTQAAQLLVKKANEARQYTDTGTFALRCGTCQIGVKGEKEATEHAKATGHTNFQEY